MKKKILLTVLPAVAVILAIVLILSQGQMPKIKAADISELDTAANEDSKKWNAVTEGEVRLASGHTELHLSAETGHFTVLNKENGLSWSSVSNVTDDEGDGSSELILTYYDADSTQFTMNSFKNSVENGSFKVYSSGNRVRVEYSIQRSKVKNFVPAVISKTSFEEKILPKLESGKRRRLKLFYTLYEPNGKDADTKKMQSEYPALKSQALYILNDSATATVYPEITGYMSSAGYTSTEYADELEKLKIENADGADMPAAFTVTVEYSLNEDGFSAAVLTDLIESDSEKYKLTGISMLPYFGAAEKSDGWMLVPDGSGAIIKLAEKGGASYTQSVYGADPAVERDRQSAVIQNAGMPIFGMNDGAKSLFAVIEDGAAVADIKAEVYGNEYLNNRIYAEFRCRAIEGSDAGLLRRQGDIKIFSKDCVSENLKIRYILSGADTTYSDMSRIYREYLIKNGALKEKAQSNAGLFLDFSGYELSDSTFMGVSVKKKTVYSDIAGISSAINYLENNGINTVNVRLKAYGSGGLYPSVQNGFRLDKSVGSEKELAALAESVKNSGGLLYLENSYSTVFNTGNGFNKMKHASRGLRKTVIKGIDYDLVARVSAEAEFEYMMTSPIYFSGLTDNFIASVSKKFNDCKNFGYSRSDYGSKLWSDFNESNQIDRSAAQKASEKAFETAARKFAGTMTDGSDSFVLKCTDNILNLPLESSGFSCESYSVPFYQMTVHGYKTFAGAAVNISRDTESNLLKSAESGAALYFSFYTNADINFKETNAGTLIYPTYFGDWAEKTTEYQKRFEKIFGSLNDKVITKHTVLQNGLRVTEYENGCEIAVNYSDSDVEYNGVKVSARDFAVISGGEK